MSEAEEIRARVDKDLIITVSIGATYCGKGLRADWKEMLERADKAVFAAKRAGRNRVHADRML